MAKALKPLVIALLILSFISFVLGMFLFSQRNVLKKRTQTLENAAVTFAQNIHTNVNAENLKKVETMDAELNALAASASIQYETLQNTKADLETTRAELGKTKEELATTKSELSAAQAKVTELTDSLAQKEAEVAQAKSQIDQLQQDKTALQTQIDELNNQLVKNEEEMRDLQDENATLNKIIKDMEAEKPGGKVVDVPRGTHGRVAVVNPTWNFVILDIGSAQKLKPNVEMLVYRGDKLVGKVRVSNVQQNMSIAEIMTDWEQAAVHEGDNVLF